MNFSHSDRAETLREQVRNFLHDDILPANRDWLTIAGQRVVARHELKHAKANLGRITDCLANATGAP